MKVAVVGMSGFQIGSDHGCLLAVHNAGNSKVHVQGVNKFDVLPTDVFALCKTIRTNRIIMESLHVETLKLNHMLIHLLSFYLLLQDVGFEVAALSLFSFSFLFFFRVINFKVINNQTYVIRIISLVFTVTQLTIQPVLISLMSQREIPWFQRP